ncbi:MAG: YjbQ family protein, partial [Clostridia bacterium]
RIDFKHQHDTPSDAAGHVKSSLIGVSIPLIINDGKLLLGSSQGVFFLEFDGPRSRQYTVKIIKDMD